jgi:DNA-binding response OmpR family regulator
VVVSRRIGNLLADRATENLVGRREELAILLRALEEDGPLVIHIHGIGGVGKTSLLEAFAPRARARGAAVAHLDCRAIEPTEHAFVRELGAAIGGDPATPEEAAERLGSLGSRVVLILDTYEVFRAMDTWLRQVFVPVLPDSVRVILCGREPPVSAWVTSPGWRGLFRSLALEPLDERDAVELLARAGVGQQDARRINRIARGHPLALQLAASAATEQPHHDSSLEEVAIQRVVEELARIYLADIDDPLARRALEAASVVRRATHPLLHAMLPEVAPQDAFDRLRALPFVESSRHGLHVHDVVQQAVAAALRANDPGRHRDYRRTAWSQLRTEVRTAGVQDLWRYTADMLYVLENPVVREAFFPSGAHLFVVEPARPDDGSAIREISERHEGPTATKLVDELWSRAPQIFRVVREPDGTVCGFICPFDPETVNPTLLRDDPILRRWSEHLERDPVPKGQRVLFYPRELSREHGEAPSSVQGAILLEIKRLYMEMRPQLRRIYCAQRDIETQWAALQHLGFRRIPEADVELEGAIYHTIILDFGPSSVDGWLSSLVAAELGVEEKDEILDVEARELIVDGQRVGLTPLEFAVMNYLYQREGKAVTRVSLLADGWGYNYEGGSNVVDVVVRSLRKKLGERASMIETVTGVGYRFRRG